MTAENFALTCAGGFFLGGLLGGAWKYARIVKSPEARAPGYVDAAHRASLLYAFACVLLAELSRRSVWPNAVNLWVCVVLVAFFAISVLAYVVHGALGDTDNQFRRPHRMGARTIPAGLMFGFMVLLALSEVGGFVILLAGFLAGLGQGGTPPVQ